jgi:hypothetical protein
VSPDVVNATAAGADTQSAAAVATHISRILELIETVDREDTL